MVCVRGQGPAWRVAGASLYFLGQRRRPGVRRDGRGHKDRDATIDELESGQVLRRNVFDTSGALGGQGEGDSPIPSSAGRHGGRGVRIDALEEVDTRMTKRLWKGFLAVFLAA